MIFPTCSSVQSRRQSIHVAGPTPLLTSLPVGPAAHVRCQAMLEQDRQLLEQLAARPAERSREVRKKPPTPPKAGMESYGIFGRY